MHTTSSKYDVCINNVLQHAFSPVGRKARIMHTSFFWRRMHIPMLPKQCIRHQLPGWRVHILHKTLFMHTSYLEYTVCISKHMHASFVKTTYAYFMTYAYSALQECIHHSKTYAYPAWRMHILCRMHIVLFKKMHTLSSGHPKYAYVMSNPYVTAT